MSKRKRTRKRHSEKKAAILQRLPVSVRPGARRKLAQQQAPLPALEGIARYALITW